MSFRPFKATPYLWRANVNSPRKAIGCVSRLHNFVNGFRLIGSEKIKKSIAYFTLATKAAASQYRRLE